MIKRGGPEWEAHVASMMLREMLTGDLTWWWLSFADGDLPEGSQFLGGCLVQAFGFGTAVAEARRRGINPGGEVLGAPIPERAPDPPERWTNRLLSKAQIEEFDAEMIAARQAPPK